MWQELATAAGASGLQPGLTERLRKTGMIAVLLASLATMALILAGGPLPSLPDAWSPSGGQALAPAPAPAAEPTTNLHALPPEELADVNCATCHQMPRNLADANDLRPSIKEACLGCHADQKHQLAEVSVHPPFRDGECTTCHKVHPTADQTSVQPYLLTKPSSELCLTCHASKLEQFGALLHPPVENGQCTTCHTPHGSSIAPTLKAEPPELCFTCHRSIADKAFTSQVQHPPAVQGNCLACHSPHGSDSVGQLKAPLKEVCYTCHAGPMAQMNSWHRPVQEGWCSSCHEPHGGQNETLLKAPGSQMCLTCHRK
jgi:predicted CXXCH cytochrome family protein